MHNTGSLAGSVISMLVLLVGAVVVLIPLVWTFSMALKPNNEMLSMDFFPRAPRILNFIDAIQAIPFFNIYSIH